MKIQSFENLDWDEILQKLEDFATSSRAKEKLRKLQPLGSPSLAFEGFEHIRESQLLLQKGKRAFMESLDLYSTWHQRLSKEAVLKTLELKDLRHFCMEALALREILKESETPWLQSIYRKVMDSSEPLSAMDQIMTPEGEIRSDASETLFSRFREKSQISRQVQNILDRLVKQHEMEPVLQDRYVTTREGRWVLPVKGGMQHHFEGIIHGASQTKQTVFMEPKEIIPLNNRLREVDVEIEEEIERLLTQLSGYLFSRLKDFETTQDQMCLCDQVFAQAQMAIQMEANPCEFSQAEMKLLEVRHPLLSLSAPDKVIPNSVDLNPEKRILLLSGPNAGGKTVLLKSVGLAAQMARCGLLICAEEGSKIPFFTDIYVAVGDAQSVDEQLSTFAAHLQILNGATQAKGPSHLLLIDEICGSTDPEEGTALARSFIQAYAENKVFGVITSHLGPLKLGWDNDSGVINGSLEYDNQSGRPTYQFIMGVPGQSLALQTAKRVGVNPQIVEKAIHFLSPEMRQYQQNLSQIEEMKAELRGLKEKLLAESQQLKKEKSRYHALAAKFDKERDQMLEQAKVRAERKVDKLIQDAKLIEVFKRHENLEKMKSQLPEMIKASKILPPNAKLESAEDFIKAFPPGTKVFVPSIGKDAIIQGFPGSRGEVPVLSASMRLMIPWEDLKPPQSAMNPTQEIVRRSAIVSPLTDADPEIDLRGRSVEEALEHLEVELDKAALHQEDRIKIIHGHGTETLKKNIRSYLSRSLYVKKWQAGGAETGGDGVTWVELRD